MAQSDSTMVLKIDGQVVATASLNEELEWSINTNIESAEFLQDETAILQRFTDDELEDLSPADGEPQAVLLTRAAETFGWEVEYVVSSKLRQDTTP